MKEQVRKIHELVMELSDELFEYLIKKKSVPPTRIAYYAFCATVARLGVQIGIPPEDGAKYIKSFTQAMHATEKRQQKNLLN